MLTDTELLRRYVQDASESAFSELVARHVDFVYATALRLANGDHALAEDVAQAVFLDLAKKAPKLMDHRVLVGWLHISTRYSAAKAIRSEQTRKRLEQNASHMKALLENGSQQENWSELRPVIDKALSRLTNSERDAVLLRFFEHKSFAEVGSLLGCGEEAARKRIARGLDRLRGLLSAEGISISTAALSLALNAGAVESAPVGLASNLAKTSLVNAAGSSTSTLELIWIMAATKTKITFATLLSLLLAGGISLKLTPVQTPVDQEPASVQTRQETPRSARSELRTASRPLSGRKIETDPAIDAALAKIRGALEEPGLTRRYPQPAMEEGIKSLGENRKLAVPILREALGSFDAQIRQRAASGLQLIGPDAIEAAEDLTGMLRASNSSSDAVHAAGALEFIGVSEQIIPNLVQILKENPEARLGTANLLGSIGEPSKSAVVVEALKPLLDDNDMEVRTSAAYILALHKRAESGSSVIDIAIQALASGDENLTVSGLTTLANAGAAASPAVPALIKVTAEAKRPDIRMSAMRLIKELDPTQRQQNAGLDAQLTEHERAQAFSEKAKLGNATVSELIDSLVTLPKSAPTAATALGSIGFDGFRDNPNQLIAAVHALKGTLGSEDPMAREAAANALKKLQPSVPKEIYSLRELTPAFDTITAGLENLNSDGRAKIRAALDIFLDMSKSSWKHEGPPTQVSFGQLNILASSLREADRKVYDEFAKEIKKIDPEALPK